MTPPSFTAVPPGLMDGRDADTGGRCAGGAFPALVPDADGGLNPPGWAPRPPRREGEGDETFDYGGGKDGEVRLCCLRTKDASSLKMQKGADLA